MGNQESWVAFWKVALHYLVDLSKMVEERAEAEAKRPPSPKREKEKYVYTHEVSQTRVSFRYKIQVIHSVFVLRSLYCAKLYSYFILHYFTFDFFFQPIPVRQQGTYAHNMNIVTVDNIRSVYLKIGKRLEWLKTRLSKEY